MNKKAPPPWVVDHFELPQQNWIPAPPGAGRVARTWVSSEWVLQSRPTQLLDRMLVLHQLGDDIYLPGLSFVGPLRIESNQKLRPAKTRMNGDNLWNLQPRLRELRPLCSPHFSTHQLMKNSMLVFPEVLAELQYFAGVAPPHKIASLPPTTGVGIQKAGFKKLLLLADQLCPLPKNPLHGLSRANTRSHLVLSHGDPTLKNTLLTPSGPCLIDWESVAVLPRHMDLVHIVAYVCKVSLPQHWDEIIWRHWELARRLLPSWDGCSWHTACCWYLAREILAFPIQDQEKLELYWKGLHEQIKRVTWKYD